MESEKLKAEIKDYIEKNLKVRRLVHTYGVADEGIKLAERFGADAEKAELAGLFHDMFKNTPVDEMNEYVRKYGLSYKLINNPDLAHAKVAAEVMKRDYGIDDEDLLNAVSYHTTGRPEMSTLEKVVFLADAIEPSRDYPTVDNARKLAYESLDIACLAVMERTIEYLKSCGVTIDDETLIAKDYLKENLDL